jgi:S-adenosylmethionine:diacylglycerol 3-amino-3-carboxypropyl transferase|tara:strand:- start:211 stop:570 length:360 start_codon:yes stop_codon:yes gene_type:complete
MKKIEFIISSFIAEMMPNLFNNVLKNIKRQDEYFLRDFCDGDGINVKFGYEDDDDFVIYFEDKLYEYISNNINDVKIIVGKKHKEFFKLTEKLEQFYIQEEEYEKCKLLKEIRENWKKF